MKQQRFDEAQIIGILKQQESGVTVAQICRDTAISEGTFYRWKSKYGGMEVHEATRLLEEWAHKNQIKLHFIEPGKPTQNGVIESFNGKMRDECLNLE